MRKPIIVTLVLMFFLAPGSSCFGDIVEDYYPLKDGITWVYSVESSKSGTFKIKVTNLGSKELQGKTVFPRRWEVGGGVRYYYVAKDDDGLYRYAEQKTESEEPKVLSTRVYYLRTPLTKGTTWDMSVKMGEENLRVNATIESLSETVQVPAGTYKDCLKIKHEGGLQTKEDGGADISLTAYEWYAPGVGLVKSMFTIKRKAKAKGGAEETESNTYRLESFKR